MNGHLMPGHGATTDSLISDSREARLALLAIAGAIAGAVGAVPVLPGGLLLLSIGVLILIGPGSLALSFFPGLPVEAVCGLVPVVGLAVHILVVSGLLILGVYEPLPILLAMATVTLVGGLLRLRYLGRRKGLTS